MQTEGISLKDEKAVLKSGSVFQHKFSSALGISYSNSLFSFPGCFIDSSRKTSKSTDIKHTLTFYPLFINKIFLYLLTSFYGCYLKNGILNKVKAMKVSATLKSSLNHHEIVVQSDGNEKTMQLSSHSSGYGSSVNGGELLMLSLATCFCNDLYREAGKRNMEISGVEVIVNGEFETEGKPGSNFTYTVNVLSDEPDSEIKELIFYTDKVAEIQNTLRKGISVKLSI